MDYTKLTADLKVAAAASREAAKGEDGGTCNLDSVFLVLPRAKEEKVNAAMTAAGVNGFKTRWLGSTGFLIAPPGTGQGNSRCRGMEAMKKVLVNAGYDVSGYYQMD